MITAIDLTTELTSTTADLLQTLTSFEQEQINVIPFEGSWTAGQVAEHILKSASGGLRNITGPVRPADRDPEQHIAMLRQIFLDFTIKMNSPDFVIPSNEPKNKESLLAALKETLVSMNEVAETKDLTEICTAFAMPNLGELTRKEWISFITVHTIRHTHQLKNIKAQLGE